MNMTAAKYAALLALALASGLAMAEGMPRQFTKEQACDSYQTQEARLQLFNGVMAATALQDQGRGTPQIASAKAEAIQALIDISKKFCREITGTYTATDARALGDGTQIQIQFDKRTRLWVMQ